MPKNIHKQNKQGPSHSLGTNPFSISQQHNGSDLGLSNILNSEPPEIDPLTDIQPDKLPSPVTGTQSIKSTSPVIQLGTSESSDSVHSSEDENDEDHEELTRMPRDAVWFQKVIKRPDQPRTNIYYYELDETKCLRILKEVRQYQVHIQDQYAPLIYLKQRPKQCVCFLQLSVSSFSGTWVTMHSKHVGDLSFSISQYKQDDIGLCRIAFTLKRKPQQA